MKNDSGVGFQKSHRCYFCSIGERVELLCDTNVTEQKHPTAVSHSQTEKRQRCRKSIAFGERQPCLRPKTTAVSVLVEQVIPKVQAFWKLARRSPFDFPLSVVSAQIWTSSVPVCALYHRCNRASQEKVYTRSQSISISRYTYQLLLYPLAHIRHKVI